MELDTFLTAYDPSDLPGGSIDPLGFGTAYLHLAEKVLPDMTDVASQPRYFSVLCAGAWLAEVHNAVPPMHQYARRLECVLRLERLWVLANVLASERAENDELLTGGIRGITYGQARACHLLDRGLKYADDNYKLLSRQMPYGLVGIYGAVADRLRMIERKTFHLTPDLGEVLGEAFCKETKMPNKIRAAVREGGRISVDQLAAWGQRSHISQGTGDVEARCMWEAFNLNPTRHRMGVILEENPRASNEEGEQSRLRRIVARLRTSDKDRDLLEAIEAIVAFEECYRLAMTGFERLLWLCRNLTTTLGRKHLIDDAVLANVRDRLPGAKQRLLNILTGSTASAFCENMSRLDPVRAFLVQAASACPSVDDFADALLSHHRDVQAGKFDRGRRKTPWIERQNGNIVLTFTRAGGRRTEVTKFEDIVPHYYRLTAADNMLWAAKRS